MKTFMYVEEFHRPNRTYGGAKVGLKVYQVKQNKPEFLGRVEYHTGATMGAVSEVNRFLKENKHVPKTWSKNDYYYTRDESKYIIHDLTWF